MSLPRTGAEELATGSDLSAGERDGVIVDLVRCAEAEPSPGAMIERVRDVVAAGLSEMAEGCPFREVLADESVGVFVGAAFPGMVRIGEVEACAEVLLDVLVAMELDSVVGSDGADLVRLIGEQCDQVGVGVLDGGARQWCDADEAGLSFHGSEDAGLALAVHRVGFPIANANAALDDFGTLVEEALASEATAAVVSPVPFAAAFASTAQVRPERAAGLLVAPDPSIDRLMTHDWEAIQPSPSDNLGGAPALREQGLYRPEVRESEAGITSRSAPSPVRHFYCHLRPIRSVVRGRVALHLACNRAAMPM